MKTIHINKQIGIESVLFNDNQPHIKLSADFKENDVVDVYVSLTNSILVLEMLEVANALDHQFCKKRFLHIPYLMGARSDRVMTEGDSFDLEVIAALINSMNFERVYLYDVHSEVSTALIKNSINISNRALVEKFSMPNSVLIVPDAGAVKKAAKYLEWNPNITKVIYCTKVRDLSNKGRISLKVLEPENCINRNCVIIDDLCDGGGTFIEIAKQLNQLQNSVGSPDSITLIVTHGIFSKGMSDLNFYFEDIITSNSYNANPDVSVVVNLIPEVCTQK